MSSTERIGYVIAVINQASHIAETVESEELYPDQASAEAEAEGWRQHAARHGRRDRYIVCEAIPVEDPS